MIVQDRLNDRLLLGLEIVDKIIDTEAVLIANPHTTHMNVIDLIKRRLLGKEIDLTREKPQFAFSKTHVHVLNSTHHDTWHVR